MQITIGRAKRGIGRLLPGQAYVGRPNVLGKAFVLGRDGSREEVVTPIPTFLPSNKSTEAGIIQEL
jgi:hypothetical protein